MNSEMSQILAPCVFAAVIGICIWGMIKLIEGSDNSVWRWRGIIGLIAILIMLLMMVSHMNSTS